MIGLVAFADGLVEYVVEVVRVDGEGGVRIVGVECNELQIEPHVIGPTLPSTGFSPLSC